MSIRTVEFTVKDGSINPQSVTPGGTQKEHNPTRVKFNLDSEYASLLRAEAVARNGTLFYRFDIYDGEGGLIMTDSNALESDAEYVDISLTENITRYGGTVTIYIVFTIVANEKTVFEDYSEPAKIILKDLPDQSAPGDDTERESLTTLAEVAKAAAQRSETAAESADSDAQAASTARDETVAARFALEHADEFIFFGGDSEHRSETDIVVDMALSATSANAIANKAVTLALLDRITEAAASVMISQALSNLLSSSDFAKKVFLLNHKVGDIYVTLNSTNPAQIYTGTTWQLVGQGRALVGVGTGTDMNGIEKTFTAGNNNGEYEHELLVREMPSHKHGLVADINYPERATMTGSQYRYSPVDRNNTSETNATGGGQPHNTLPPSYAVYLWKRLS